MLSKLYERTSVIITTNLSFGEWAAVFGDGQLADRLRLMRFNGTGWDWFGDLISD